MNKNKENEKAVLIWAWLSFLPQGERIPQIVFDFTNRFC